MGIPNRRPLHTRSGSRSSRGLQLVTRESLLPATGGTIPPERPPVLCPSCGSAAVIDPGATESGRTIICVQCGPITTLDLEVDFDADFYISPAPANEPDEAAPAVSSALAWLPRLTLRPPPGTIVAASVLIFATTGFNAALQRNMNRTRMEQRAWMLEHASVPTRIEVVVTTVPAPASPDGAPRPSEPRVAVASPATAPAPVGPASAPVTGAPAEASKSAVAVSPEVSGARAIDVARAPSEPAVTRKPDVAREEPKAAAPAPSLAHAPSEPAAAEAKSPAREPSQTQMAGAAPMGVMPAWIHELRGEPQARAARDVPVAAAAPPHRDLVRFAWTDPWTRIEEGMTKHEVSSMLGPPRWHERTLTSDFWMYETKSILAGGVIVFQDGRVFSWRGP
jgi:hypothetical protein